MSKKSGKRKSSFNSEAAVLSHLQAVRETLDSSNTERDPNLLVTHTTTILQLITDQVSERKALVHKSSAGIEILFKCLQEADDHEVVWNVVSTLNCLAQYKHTVKMCKEGAIPVVLNSLYAVSRFSDTTDSLLLLFHSLLARLAGRDKKFAVKARLSGVLPITAGLLKRCQGEQHALKTILSVMKTLASNSNNAVSFGKHGCLAVLSKLLSGIGRKDFVILKHCVEVVSALLKQQHNASKPSAQGCVKQLISLHEHLHHADRQCRHIALRRALLTAIKMAVGTDSCLQAFHKANGLHTLHSTASACSEAENKELYPLATLTCTVLRKCLPKVPMPVTTDENPVQFQLPHRTPVVLANGDTGAGEGMLQRTMHTSHSAPLLSLTSGAETQQQHLHPIERGPTVLKSSAQSKSGVSSQTSSSSVEFLDLGALDTDNKPLTMSVPTEDDQIQEPGVEEDTREAPLRKPIVFAVGDSVSEDDLSRFDKFFPELQDITQSRVSDNMHKVQSSPALTTQAENEPMIHQCQLEGSRRPLHEISQDQPPQVFSQLDATPAHDLCTPLPAIVVPTASVIPEHSTEDSDDDGDIFFSVHPTPSHKLHNPPHVQMTDISLQKNNLPKSVLSFTEHPHPQILGHVPLPEPEPQYRKTPAVERKLTLSDVARYITPESLINKTVFDLETFTSSAESIETREPKPAITNLDVESTECIESSSSTNHTISPICMTFPEGTLEEDHLTFDSCFESGNLRKAIQVRRYEYDLLLNSDINSDHHHQWFYFKVSNTEGGIPYRFNVINCEKVNSQFNLGMQPLLYSVTEAKQGRRGWVRTGCGISYYRNNFVLQKKDKQLSTKTKSFYTLTFTLVFPYSNGTYYLAYHYPYTYSMMQADFEDLERGLDHSQVFYNRQTLCTTLGGNDCPLVTISSVGSPRELLENSLEGKGKKYILLSARVHPGESNASWVMRGVLQYLLSDHPTAQALRSKFVFKVVPMLNPDGVINGSHRCSLSGQDLNRQWITPDPLLHPTIYYTKGLIQWMVAHDRPPFVYCDFHGHSRKKNVFMYGCRDPTGSRVEEVLPRLLYSLAPAFSFKSCSFVVEKSKEATARVVVWRRLAIARSYTMESTYCGADQGPYKGKQITTQSLEEMGQYFCMALLQLEELSTSLEELPTSLEGLEGDLEPLVRSKKTSTDDEDTADSESDGDGGGSSEEVEETHDDTD